MQVLDATWGVSEGPGGMEEALHRICQEADQAIADGYSYLIISDRATGQSLPPIAPSATCSGAGQPGPNGPLDDPRRLG